MPYFLTNRQKAVGERTLCPNRQFSQNSRRAIPRLFTISPEIWTCIYFVSKYAYLPTYYVEENMNRVVCPNRQYSKRVSEKFLDGLLVTPRLEVLSNGYLKCSKSHDEPTGKDTTQSPKNSLSQLSGTFKHAVSYCKANVT